MAAIEKLKAHIKSWFCCAGFWPVNDSKQPWVIAIPSRRNIMLRNPFPDQIIIGTGGVQGWANV
jgi:hypothetical protein